MNNEDHDDFEENVDPEIMGMIFYGLTYEISALYTPTFHDGKQNGKELRRKMQKGEVCLCCREVPTRNYDPAKKFSPLLMGLEGDYCQECYDTLKKAGQICDKCHYSFPKKLMHTPDLCELCFKTDEFYKEERRLREQEQTQQQDQEE